MKKSKTLKKAVKSQLAAARPKERRFFSEAARKAIIAEVDAGLTIAEASRKYEVNRRTVHEWRTKYSPNYSPTLVTIVEHESDSERNKKLEAELAELYQSLGKLQASKMLLEKIIDLADQHYQTDLKKTFASNPSSVYKKNAKSKK